MYLKETSKTQVWFYKITKHGIKAIKDKCTNTRVAWFIDWHDLIDNDWNREYPHQWDALTDDEYFLEAI